MTVSAKSLFRATRAKTTARAAAGFGDHWPEQRAPEETRRERDYYPTGEPEAVRALLAVDGGRIAELGAVWEPACGDGAMVREIRAHGLACSASDIADRGCPDAWVADFYTCRRPRGGAIVTNPPYCESCHRSAIGSRSERDPSERRSRRDDGDARDGGGRWLAHTLAMPDWRYCALLLSWDWPAAVANGLGALLDTHPFSYAYLLRWKLDFTGGGSPPQRNAWFVWDRDDTRAEPAFRWLERRDARQATPL